MTNEGLLRRLLGFWFFLVLTGCQPDGTVRLTHWHFASENQAADVVLPTDVRARLRAEPSSYELTAEVDVPEEWRGRRLTMAIPRLGGVTSLRVNGESAWSMEERETWEHRPVHPHRFGIPPSATSTGHLALALTVEARMPEAGILDAVPRLSATENGDVEVLRMKAFHQVLGVMAFALMAVMFLENVCFGIVARLRRHGTYAALSAGGMVYAAYGLGWTQRIFGTNEGYVVLAVLLSCAVLMIQSALRDLGRKGAWVFWLVWMAYCLVALPLHAPFEAMVAIVAGPMMLLGFGVYCIFRPRQPLDELGMYYASGERLCLPLALGIGSLDSLYYFGSGHLLGGWRFAPLGLTLAAALALTMLAAFGKFFKDRADLLEKHARDIDGLNEVLRRQLSANATELASAIVRASSSGLPTSPMKRGMVIAGQYAIQKRLGSGGMGVVYQVEALADGARYAMKILQEGRPATDLARFAREAHAALKVSSDRVVAVHDVGVTQHGRLFVVMELVQGPALGQEQGRYGEIEWCVHVLHDLAVGLAEVHRAGIVHRDLKPSNVLLVYPAGETLPKAKISDFGVAMLSDPPKLALAGNELAHGDSPLSERAPLSREHDLAITMSGHLLGTPKYMAPEVHHGAKAAGPAADVFAFGLIAREILGVLNRSSEVSVGMAMAAGISPEMPPLGDCFPDLDPDLARMLDDCLLLDPGSRPSAERLAEALRWPFRAGQQATG